MILDNLYSPPIGRESYLHHHRSWRFIPVTFDFMFICPQIRHQGLCKPQSIRAREMLYTTVYAHYKGK